jgi:hypothetical protein
MWEPAAEKWIHIRDWEEHKRQALRKLDERFMPILRACS